MKINLTHFEAVIFDMDGVLVNSEPFYRKIESTLFKKLGLEISEEEHNTYQGVANIQIWKTIIEKHGLANTLEELMEMTNAMVIPFFKNIPVFEPMPGVEDLIGFFEYKKMLLAVATSSTPDVIEIVLQKSGLHKYFKVIVDSKMAGSSKPDPDIFLLAAKTLGIPPKKCLVIEDSTNGIRAAKSAGMFCVAFAGPGSETQDQSQADVIIGNFGELMN